MMTLTVQRVLLALAIVCLLLAAIGVPLGSISVGWLGLALFAAAHWE